MAKDGYQSRLEVLQGTLDLLILQTLQWGPRHGYGISQAMASWSGDLFQVDTGSLYPALHRLERKKWVSSKWKVSETGREVKIYSLTPKGKKQLLSERSRWDQLSAGIAGILSPDGKVGAK